MRPTLVAILAALALACPAARAQDADQATTRKVDIAGRTIPLPAPFGYCDLDPDHARDRLLIDGLDRLPQQDRVLRRMSPCDELKAWRGDPNSDPIEVVQFLWPERMGAIGNNRGAFLRRAVPGEILGKTRAIERAGQGFPADATERIFATIGVVERTERAAVLAQAVVARIDGRTHQLVALSATTAVGPTALTAQILSLYDDGSELDWMLRDAREHVDRLLSASGEKSTRFRESRPQRPEDVPPGEVTTRKTRVPRERSPSFFDTHGGYIALGLLGGGALLIGIGLLVARRLRPAP